MRRVSPGFTLAEVAIAGVILLAATVFVAQLTRSTLDAAASSAANSVQLAPLVEQLMASQVSAIKAYRDNPERPASGSIPASGILIPSIARIPFGTESLYAEAVRSGFYYATATPTYGGNYFFLNGYDVYVKMTRNNATHSSDPTLGHTYFWKHGVSGNEKTGI